MKKLDRRMKKGSLWGSRYTIPAAVLISGIVSMGMFLWIDRITQTQRIDFLHKDALMDVQISAAIFHLRVDEFFAGTCRENWRNILEHFDSGLKLSHALLFGGETEHGGRLPPLKEPAFREEFKAVESRLKTIKEIALQRYEHPEDGRTGLPLEKVFDTSFSDFITSARALEILADKRWISQNTRTRHLLYVLALAWTASLIALSLVLYKQEVRRKQAEMALKNAYDEMEQKVRDRTSELSNANRRLQVEIDEHRRTEKELKRSRQELRSLMEHLQSVREEERTWVAREIHDQLGQALTSLSMDLTWLEGKLSQKDALPGPDLKETINSMSTSIDGAIRLIHEISSELRPGVLDNVGLIAAIEWQAARFCEKTGLECNLSLPSGEVQLDAGRSTALFRVFQEIMTNVARHANAREVSIRLTQDFEVLMLEVNDNGRGITHSEIFDSRSFGIQGMRERIGALGGELRIEGAEAQGTTVVLRIPLGPENGLGEKSDA